MEVFLASVAHRATEQDLTEAIADIVHFPLVRQSSGPPCNFSVNVFTNKSKKTGRPATNANVTFADAGVGERFLSLYGPPARGLLCCGRCALVLPSKRAVDPVRVRELQTNPFVRPADARERDRDLAGLKEPIALSSIHFGRLAFKNDTGSKLVFQSAYERVFTNGTVSLDGEKRVLVVSFDPFSVVIPLGSIKSVQAVSDSRDVLVSLNHPPTYYTTSAGPRLVHIEMYLARLSLDSAPPKLRRIPVLDEEHAKTAAFSSLHILLTFPSFGAVESFKNRRSSAVRLPRVGNIRLERDSLVTAAADLLELQSELAKLDIRTAFQLELLLRNGILGPDQILTLLPTAESLEQAAGAEQAERVLSRFASRLVHSRSERWTTDDNYGGDGWYDDDPDDYLNPSSIARPFGQVLEQGRRSVVAKDLVTQLEHVRDTTPKLPPRGLDETLRLHYGRHVVLTGSGMRLEGPLPDESNSIIRRYPDHVHHFLRVSVREEDMTKISSNRDVDVPAFLRARFGPIFKSTGGLELCGRKFDFLGFSSSALREHSTWFLNPFTQGRELVTADKIRRSLGNFTSVIHIPARYMARIAQAFTATQPTLNLTPDQVGFIGDIASSTGSVFTDGVGKISAALAEEVDQILSARRPRKKNRVKSTCYQIRLGGIKGMLSIDPLLTGKVVQFRPSQRKFDSFSRSLDIAGTFEGPLPCYLNRPFIKILEDLGIPIPTFVDLQTAAAKDIGTARSSLKDAAKMLDRVGLGGNSKLSSTLLHLSQLINVPPHEVDAFIETCVDVAVADALRSLKFKARIPVWGSHTLVGVADEGGYLREGEIYACIKKPGKAPEYISGDVCITRSPCVHPGDVQVVRAVGRLPPGCAPRLQALTNCVVFSCRGSRSLPSCLGGGDLDGDIYQLVTLPSLIPARQNVVKPAEYPPPQMNSLSRAATTDDGVDFFLEYILADIMGMVANRHLQLADYYPEGARHPDCIALAAMHSTAVDYPKTGTPVRFAEMPKSPSALKPNFMVPEYWAGKKGNEKLYYTSDKALGVLFRAIPLKDTRPRPWLHDSDALDPSRTITNALLSLTFTSSSLHRLPLSSSATLRNEMRALLEWYASDLFHYAQSNTLSKRPEKHLSEVEAFLGTIAAPAKVPRQRQDLVARLQLQTRELYEWTQYDLFGAAEDGSELEPEEQILRAWAAWQVALDSDGGEFGVKAFGMLALQSLFEAREVLEGEEL
ncbi:hypothetical protein JCM6882_000114 [Rhodosporidiobolus microsporus]